MQTMGGEKAKISINSKANPNIKVWFNIMPDRNFISIAAFDKNEIARPPNKLKHALIEENYSTIDR